jgi:uncharacterized protein (DUF983 family)
MNQSCPFCERGQLEHDSGQAFLRCDTCGERTHAKIEAHRDELTALADDGGPAGDVAALLLGGERV